jgi:hypothetical protein
LTLQREELRELRFSFVRGLRQLLLSKQLQGGSCACLGTPLVLNNCADLFELCT